MLKIANRNGYLIIDGEIPIPSAPGGEWDEARIETLKHGIEKIIVDTVTAAEMVDSASREFDASEFASRSSLERFHTCCTFHTDGGSRAQKCSGRRWANG